METRNVYNLIILDASGSMDNIYNQALSGTNETIQTIKKAQSDHDNLIQYLTLASFNSGERYLRTVYDTMPITGVKELTREDYEVGGCTALHDAMGTMISHLQSQVKHDDIILVTIITDGHENASQHWSGSQIKSLVEELRKMGWTFTYIGANQDAIEVASRLGVHNALNYKADEEGARRMYRCESEARKSFMAKISDKLKSGTLSKIVECEDYFD